MLRLIAASTACMCLFAQLYLAQALAIGSMAMLYPWRPMREKPKTDEPTEQTPRGLTVPVPSRERFFANLRKIAKAGKPSVSRGPQK
jgi:hypothetical protein